MSAAGLFLCTEDGASTWRAPAHGCWVEILGPHLQDAPPPVLLVLGEHAAGEEGVAVEADSVGPVVIVFELSPVVGALGTHHLGGEAGEDRVCTPAWGAGA